jgi:hypothetical protein
LLLTKKEVLTAEIKKAVEMLENGKKIQIEFDTKNSILKVFELKLKRIPIGGENEKISYTR